MWKEHYRKANDSIPVNRELLEQLKQSTAKKRPNRKPYWISVAAAAAIIGVSLFTISDWRLFGPQPETTPRQPVVNRQVNSATEYSANVSEQSMTDTIPPETKANDSTLNAQATLPDTGNSVAVSEPVSQPAPAVPQAENQPETTANAELYQENTIRSKNDSEASVSMHQEMPEETGFSDAIALDHNESVVAPDNAQDLAAGGGGSKNIHDTAEADESPSPTLSPTPSPTLSPMPSPTPSPTPFPEQEPAEE